MSGLVVGVFDSERLAFAAVKALRAAGLTREGVRLVSRTDLVELRLVAMVRHLRGTRLLARDESWVRPMLWGVLCGSLTVEIPVLIWLFFMVDEPTAESWGMSLLGLRLFLGSTAWKLGPLLAALWAPASVWAVAWMTTSYDATKSV